MKKILADNCVTEDGYAIRKMSYADIDRVYEIEAQSFFDAWSKENIENEFDLNESTDSYVLEVDGRVQGFYFGWHITGESSLNNIAVAKEIRGKGYGELLLKHFLNKAEWNNSEEIFLEVGEHNIQAKTLYEKFGFNVVARRENYYQKTGEDAFLMKKNGKGH